MHEKHEHNKKQEQFNKTILAFVSSPVGLILVDTVFAFLSDALLSFLN